MTPDFARAIERLERGLDPCSVIRGVVASQR
jgi:hypothetical protein